MKVKVLVLTVMLVIAVAGIADDSKKLSIAVIPKGTTHVFWKSIHAGALKAAKEFKVDVIWKGPLQESERSSQIQIVQNFVSRKVDAIVLAPLDENALVRPVKNAVKKKIPVVIIDSSLKYDGYSSFVATDNYLGGKLCAKRLCDLLNGKGAVLMLRYMEGSASTDNREKGFLDGMKEYGPKIKLVSTNQYAGATAETAMKKSQSLLNKYKNVDGIFCPNESSTFGMLRALQMSGRAGKVKFVGFDSSDALLKALEKGQIQGLAVQNPFKMGYEGVKMAVKTVKKEKVEKRVDTGVAMVTKESLKKPDIQELVKPDLKKWLSE